MPPACTSHRPQPDHEKTLPPGPHLRRARLRQQGDPFGLLVSHSQQSLEPERTCLMLLVGPRYQAAANHSSSEIWLPSKMVPARTESVCADPEQANSRQLSSSPLRPAMWRTESGWPTGLLEKSGAGPLIDKPASTAKQSTIPRSSWPRALVAEENNRVSFAWYICTGIRG